MKLIIHGELADLNTYINKERSNRYAAAEIKKEETRRVYWECKQQKVGLMKTPVVFEFHWFSRNGRKDPDNICFAKKFILDGMVLAGVLPSDRQEAVVGFVDRFFVDKRLPRVEVYGQASETDSEIQSS